MTNLLKAYRAIIFQCSNCGKLGLYWKRTVIVPLTIAIEEATKDGWLGTPIGNYCPECNKKMLMD